MNKVVILGACLALGACSSNKVVETMNTIPPNSIADAETYAYKTKAVAEQIEIMPDWFKKMPERMQRLLLLTVLMVGFVLKPKLLLQRLVMKKLHQ